ncbi:GAF domain-like protein [Paraphysoderma sedebokerense]|nr:GAF domain-like protein [Paraphysoderma sedebokerense]
MKPLPQSDIQLQSKSAFYALLSEQARALIEDQSNWVTNTSQISSLIYHELRNFTGKPINWCGFYLADWSQKVSDSSQTKLILGPFQGKIACTMIPLGKGVCGTAALSRTTLVIPDVHQFPGHIACDSASNSEIVVPMVSKKTGSLIGVLDIDCESLSAFDDEDRLGLEKIVEVVVEGCEWPL